MISLEKDLERMKTVSFFIWEDVEVLQGSLKLKGYLINGKIAVTLEQVI